MLKEKDGKIIVESAVMEVLIPKAYGDKGIFMELSDYFSFFCVCVARFFENKTHYDNGVGVDKVAYFPITIPVMVSSKPSLNYQEAVSVPKGSPLKDFYKLVYYKGDEFIIDKMYVKQTSNIKAALGVFDDGKMDFLSPEIQAEVLNSLGSYNDASLPLPPECVEVMVASKSMSVKDSSKYARFIESDKLEEAVVSLNPRQMVMNTTSSRMFAFEDVNKALLVSTSRHSDGIIDKANEVERIILADQI
jgi:hypothetical protein